MENQEETRENEVRGFFVMQTPFPPDCRKNRITRFGVQGIFVDQEGRQHNMEQNRLIQIVSYSVYNEKDEKLADPRVELIPEQYCTDRNGQFMVKCRCATLYKEFIYIIFQFSATSFSLTSETLKTPLFQVRGRTKHNALTIHEHPNPDVDKEMIRQTHQTPKRKTFQQQQQQVTFQNLVPILESLSAKISEQHREFLCLLNNFEARIHALEKSSRPIR